jgi:hypothetical protein
MEYLKQINGLQLVDLILEHWRPGLDQSILI